MRWFLGAFCALFGFSSYAMAQGCGANYKVQSGDSLSVIADKTYKDARKWSAIYNANVDRIGDSPDKIRVGQTISLPCINGLPVGDGSVSVMPKPQPRVETVQVKVKQQVSKRALMVNLLTADDYAPFTDRNALNQGLVTEIVNSAMGQAAGQDGYRIHWVNDWSAHLDPLLSNAMLDMGFPWLQPDCKQNPDNFRCANFHFSDPMFEMLVLLFIDTSRPLRFREDADIIGKTLCRPKGYYTHDLDKDGRNWLADGKIKLEQPVSVADCFEMLTAGQVDGVALNEFLGWTKVKDLGLKGAVEPLKRPLSIEGLHVIISKKHWRGTTHLYRFNAELQELKKSKRYDEIVSKHLGVFWSNIE